MSNPVLDSREFVRGAARFNDLVYVISRGRSLAAGDIAHTSLVAVDQGQWSDAVDTEWDSAAVAMARAPEEKVVLIGEDGDVVTYVGGNSTQEAIMPPPVMIRNAREIGGHVYACGMKRQVFRRGGERQWSDMSAPRAGDTDELGFEAIDGYSQNEIYAVGWGGEIWQHDGAAWHERASPTNVILTTVCCAGDGVVYAGGQGGILVRGRNDAWAVVPWDDEVTADLWDLCWFEGRLYVATMTALFTLDRDVLVPVDFGNARPATCYSLTTAEGVLWSVGRDDVVSFDGTAWQKYK
ncbi:hypothetical protein [Variovorax boronicumulans]|uniref:hypothetical protein n=1 Tax=Variovorax boronicumulans TaxID=436515 RepID=UPI003395FF83